MYLLDINLQGITSLFKLKEIKMNQKKTRSQPDLPSMRKLIQSTILAITIAALLLWTVILPAEYGIDPTGFGNFIGLKKMGEIKTSLAEEREAEDLDQPLEKNVFESASQPTLLPQLRVETAPEIDVTSTDTMTLELRPNEGKEIKLSMLKGAKVNYAWWTDNGKANFDAHADSKPLQIKYHNYKKGVESRLEGLLEAAFDGKHGWFWRNRTSNNMVVTLTVSGDYTDIIEIK